MGIVWLVSGYGGRQRAGTQSKTADGQALLLAVLALGHMPHFLAGHQLTQRNTAEKILNLVGQIAPQVMGCLLYTSPSPRDST